MPEPDTRHDDRAPLALAAGLVTALLAGLAWAAIVLITDYELGIVAWGIGGVVGLAMAAVTRSRSRGLAVAAAGLALVGLIAGKAFVVYGSTGGIVDEIMATPEYLNAAVAWQMYEAGELEPETMQAVEATEAAGDTLSDAVWEQMLDQGSARIATLSREEQRQVAEEVASGIVGQMSIVDGIMAQLSGFDLLWLALAMGTAYKIMDAAPPELELAAEAEGEADRPPEDADGPVT